MGRNGDGARAGKDLTMTSRFPTEAGSLGSRPGRREGNTSFRHVQTEMHITLPT